MKRRLLLLMFLLTAAIVSVCAQEPKFPLFDQALYDKYIDAAKEGDAEAQFQVALSFDTRDYEAAIAWLRKAGEQDHKNAMVFLVALYAGEVKSCPQCKNPEEAPIWMKKLWEKQAANGSAKAMVFLGSLYYQGQGVKKDNAKARELFLKAANHPHPDDLEQVGQGEAMLGIFYYNGIGVDNDDEQAVYWLKRAVQHNAPSGIAEATLGRCCFNGEGMKQDYDQAVYWFELSISKGNKKAEDWLVRAKEKQKEQQLLVNRQKSTIEEQPLPVMPTKADVMNVDENIPQTNQKDIHTFAVIIGNEHYESEAAVPFAEHDAKVFKEYVQKTLGVPENQINFISDAGLNKIRSAVRWLKDAMEAAGGQGKGILYYAGHGIPDEADKDAYLLPVDGIGSDVESAYPLTRLYKELGALPAERITVFLDACFSGAKREGDMMASARGVAIKVKETAPQGNMIVFTAAQGDETAYPFKSQKHGMFTYYLLKKLQETQGNATLGELGDYLTTEVKRQSFVENNKVQTPTIVPSVGMQNTWREMSLK